MKSSSTILKGVIHGKTIELETETGLADGQRVTVTLDPVDQRRKLPPGEGIRRSAGGWAENEEELDQYLEWNREQRKISRPELEP